VCVHPNQVHVGNQGVAKLCVVPAGALPVPVSDRLNTPVKGLNRQIVSCLSRIYCRPQQFTAVSQAGSTLPFTRWGCVGAVAGLCGRGSRPSTAYWDPLLSR
jgi:hypothetical protein